jgi:two-component system, NtrC family, sensor histidine kinase PilS
MSSSTPPLAERDDARLLAGLILLRALIASALFGAALFANLNSVTSDEGLRGNLFVYLLAAYVSAAFEFLWVLWGRQLARLGFVHAGIEAGLAAWLVALTGGAESPFIFLLLISTILGSVAAGRRGAFIAATLASGSLLAMAVGIPVTGFVQPEHVDGRMTAVVLASGGGCFATAALASYLTERLRRTGRALSAREAELRQLGELYLKVAQSLRSGLMTLGPSVNGSLGAARVTLLNDPGAAILGISATQAQGRILQEAIPELARALDALVAGHGRMECAIRQGDRSVLLGFTLSPLKSETAELQGSVVTFQDLTQQRKLEEALRRQSHLASLGELAAGLAHEVRNPLAALSGAAQILSVGDHAAAPSDDRKLFEVIQRETTHLETLVSDFLTFARPPAPSMETGDLGKLARSTFEAFRTGEQVAQRRLSCEVEPVQTLFDEGQLRQVIWNLLRNALEATGTEGAIGLRVRSGDRSVRLEVQDDGGGVPIELRERIFEPFFTTKEHGTGLGLALVGRIVGAHGGTIDLDSTSGGTRFVVMLPRPDNVDGAGSRSQLA